MLLSKRNSHASSKLLKTTFSSAYKTANKPNKWIMGGLVKGRNEPIFIQWVFLSITVLCIFIYYKTFFCCSQVLDVISALKEMEREEVAQVIYDNSIHMFFPKVWKCCQIFSCLYFHMLDRCFCNIIISKPSLVMVSCGMNVSTGTLFTSLYPLFS